MIAIIAEKPSVAREIAAIVGASSKEDGYLKGNGYIITWALGHLVGLAMPDDYGFSGFNRAHLPIIPETFRLVPRQVKVDKGYKSDAGALKQLKVIKTVFDRCDKIIAATDAGREGELIFRYIYTYLDCRVPFDRLWISSLTDRAIKKGLQDLKAGNLYDNLYLSAKARSEADWLVGINATQALSLAAGRDVWSLGRVQTPTLVMICQRYLDNKTFVPVPYWQVKVRTEKGTVPFAAVSREKYWRKELAGDVLQLLQEKKTITVKSIEKRELRQEPPLLYDLTSLQKDMNSKHGFSADKTLSIAQKLYESKYITYPRTGSRYIPEDMLRDVQAILSGLKDDPVFGEQAVEVGHSGLNRRPINDSKVTDHHALLITENRPEKLLPDEQIVYDRVTGRMIEAFARECIKIVTVVTLNCDETLFETRGTVTKQAGWRKVFNETEEKDGEEDYLPQLTEGDQLPVLQAEVLEKQTEPKPVHTEASLLSAMETAGKEIENEVEREAIKDCGIGTPATRAATIETLFSRGYIRREKKSLIPTAKGLVVYDAVKYKRIADVAMTGEWENVLSKIESGQMKPATFRRSIEIYASQITAELLETPVPASNGPSGCLCPKCKTGQILFYPKVAKCSNGSCSLTVSRLVAGKELNDTQLSDLLAKGRTAVIKGFKGKSKSFDAAITFNKEFSTVFEFLPKTGVGRKS